MKYCKYLLLVVLSLCLGTTSVCAKKSEKYKPKWVTHKLPESKSGTYIFISAYGEGTSLDAARQKALANLATRLEVERGLKVSSVLKSKTTERFSSVERDNYYSETNELDMVVEERGKQLNIVCRTIDEYWESDRRGYRIHILYTVANKNRPGGSNDDKITVTAKYGAAGLLSVVPSVGQFYKGANTKGAAILIGEVASVAGVILCENNRATYQNWMYEKPKYAAQYNALMDTWELGRNLCIGAAGAVYIVNLIDALATKGAKHVKVKKNKMNFSMSPYMDARSTGLGMSLTF
jgi:hypothetical protein